MSVRKDGAETRRRILEIAGDVFGEKGYRDATHAEICRRSASNTAAINYHFRSKENLYVEAWRAAFDNSLKAYPPDGGIAPGAPAEERLRGRINSIIRRAADPNNKSFEIIYREMVNPTGLLSEAMHESIEPVRKGMEEVIRKLLGGKASSRQVGFCLMSVMAQCLHPMLRERRSRMLKGSALRPGFDAQETADHITAFSLAGIREIRRRMVKSKIS
jgi:AcrR family transcriptional regulator